MNANTKSSHERGVEELLISLDQLTQKLEVRLAQAQRLKHMLYQRSAETAGASISAHERAELDRLRSASLTLLAQQSVPSSRSLH